jgi:choline dehydrogenase-like flavoprotein
VVLRDLAAAAGDAALEPLICLGEAGVGVAQEDQAENRLAIFRGLELGVGAQLVRCVPQALLEVGRVGWHDLLARAAAVGNVRPCHCLDACAAVDQPSSDQVCERFGCEQFAKASPQTVILPRLFEQPNFELRANAHVTRVLLDDSGSRATGVLYVDAQGRETEQPAELVILCAYGINNVKLMLNSGIGRAYDPATGEGTVGRN